MYVCEFLTDDGLRINTSEAESSVVSSAYFMRDSGNGYILFCLWYPNAPLVLHCFIYQPSRDLRKLCYSQEHIDVLRILGTTNGIVVIVKPFLAYGRHEEYTVPAKNSQLRVFRCINRSARVTQKSHTRDAEAQGRER